MAKIGSSLVAFLAAYAFSFLCLLCLASVAIAKNREIFYTGYPTLFLAPALLGAVIAIVALNKPLPKVWAIRMAVVAGVGCILFACPLLLEQTALFRTARIIAFFSQIILCAWAGSYLGRYVYTPLRTGIENL